MWLQENYLTRGFWGDEAWTALISRLSIGDLVQVTGQDFHPPLYYLLVHIFIALFGVSEWIRAISTFFFLLALIPTYRLAKKMAGKTVAWVSTLLVALSPILFTYAFEARAYALLTFLSVYSTLLFWNALQSKKKKPWVCYAIVAALGVYTHYYMWFILAAHGIYWLLMERTHFWRVFWTYLSVVLIQLPWLPILFSQLKSVKGDYWIGAINSHTHWEFFMRVVAGDFGSGFQSYWAIGVLAIMVLTIPLIWMQNKRRLPKAYIFLWLWLVVPVILPTIVSYVYRPIFFYRYLVFSSVPILMITVWGLSAVGKKALYIVAAGLVTLSVVTDAGIFLQYPYSFREEMAKVFATDHRPTDKVKVFTYLPSFAEVYYYTGQKAPVSVVPEGLVQASGKSLLDKYEQLGLVKVENPPVKQPYWEVGPEKSSVFHK